MKFLMLRENQIAGENKTNLLLPPELVLSGTNVWSWSPSRCKRCQQFKNHKLVIWENEYHMLRESYVWNVKNTERKCTKIKI